MQDNMFFEKSLENLPGFKETLPASVLNAYLEGELTPSEKEMVESEIGRNENFRLLYEKKLKEKKLLQKAIPCRRMSPKDRALVHQEISQVIKVTLETKPENVLKKVWRFLDTPII